MSSMNAGRICDIAHLEDAARLSQGPVNLKDISEADARRLMSEEHKALGYRPPPRSLAAQAQSAVARHETEHADDSALTVDTERLKRAAYADAERIKQERGSFGNLDLDHVGEAEAKKLMSEEHKALGYRPPPDSLAAKAQAAAAKHPSASLGIDTTVLARAALEDASHISSANGNGNGNGKALDIHQLAEAEARTLMSEEHRALGYHPPPGSLAAKAQAEAAKHPTAKTAVDNSTLVHAALIDAQKIAAERSPRSPTQSSHSPTASENLNVDALTAPEARALQSEKHKALRCGPQAGSAAARSQSAVDTRDGAGEAVGSQEDESATTSSVA